MDRIFFIILSFSIFLVLSCGFCNDTFNNIKREFSQRYLEESFSEESDHYNSKVEFGFYNKESMSFEPREIFNDSDVFITPISAMVSLSHPVGKEKIRITIYKIQDGLYYIKDRYSHHSDEEWTEFVISLPIYEAGFFKVDFEYEDGETFASGTLEVNHVEIGNEE